MLKFGIKSLWNRRFVSALTILSIALSVALVLGVERLRSQAKSGFANSVSGVDLIVAARGNSVQILLATVFGVGSTNGLSWDVFKTVEKLPQVSWAVPVSMGDNHRGFPVIGTTADYFKRFRHSAGKPLEFVQGDVFAGSQQAVIGSELANRFGYEPGSEIVLAHGAGAIAFDLHDEAPFRVQGVLKQTGTAVDRMVFVSLDGFDGLHALRKPVAEDPLSGLANGDVHGEAIQAEHDQHEHEQEHEQEHDMVNAIYVGLKDRISVLSVQRALTEYRLEPLTAVLPNVALLELWSITGTAETALHLMAIAVLFAGLVGMVVMLTAALEARRREFGILRSVGAPPAGIFGLIVLEAVLITISGIILGYFILTIVSILVSPILANEFGLHLEYGLPSVKDIVLMLIILMSGMLASLVPAIRVYRMTLADGLTLRM